MPMSIQCQQWPCACTLLVCPCNYTISHYAFTLHAPHSQGRRHRHSSPNEPRSAADEWRAGHSRFETKKSHRVSSLRQKTQKAHREGPSSASRREDEVRGGVDDNKTDRNNDRKNVFEKMFLNHCFYLMPSTAPLSTSVMLCAAPLSTSLRLGAGLVCRGDLARLLSS